MTGRGQSRVLTRLAVFGLLATECAWAQLDRESASRELLAMAREDQEVRSRVFGSGRVPTVVEALTLVGMDARHTRRLRAIVQEHGWPVRSGFGEEAVRSAWLLAQHADRDVVFQERVLVLMEPLMRSGEVPPEHVAYLTDRVLVHRGRFQRFGTQYRLVGEAGETTLVPSTPIEDEEHLDERRAQWGLCPREEYEERLRMEYSLPESPR